jgi:hypothetical protein
VQVLISQQGADEIFLVRYRDLVRQQAAQVLPLGQWRLGRQFSRAAFNHLAH